MKFLDSSGVTTVWTKIKNTFVKKTDLFDLVHPIGSIYISYSADSCPLSKGTWVKMPAGRFLVGQGTPISGGPSFIAGTNYGAACLWYHTHTVPAHNHTIPAHNHGAVTTSTNGNHQHSNLKYTECNSTSGSQWHPVNEAGAFNTKNAGSHTHTVNSPAATPGAESKAITSGTAGTGTTYGVNWGNMPPFIVVNIWKRTG